jgi:hypothetical protein
MPIDVLPGDPGFQGIVVFGRYGFQQNFCDNTSNKGDGVAENLQFLRLYRVVIPLNDKIK